MSDALAGAVGVHPLTAQCLVNRGITTAADAGRFFHPAPSSLSDPRDLPGVPRAVERIHAAIARRESVLIFGDSDVDGLTASVILYEVLHDLGASVRAIPSNRITDGYGLPDSLLEELCGSATSLVILVDCGTNQSEAVRRLAARGIETIVVDHHLPLEEPAQPFALINPYCEPHAPRQELCSAGLAFKLAQALLGRDAEERLLGFLDLAALGTLADYAPLQRDNRVMVSMGLPCVVGSLRRGLQRLCEETRTQEPTPERILQRLVPRLNASGRLGDATAAWHLLRRDDHAQRETWITQVAADHATAKQLQRSIWAQAHEQVNRLHFKEQYVLVVSGTGWHQGLMGPLASQLSRQYGRPAIAIAMEEEQGTGSGRSLPILNLLETLKGCQEVLVRFGGHAQACGLTVSRRQLEAFKSRVNQRAKTLMGEGGFAQPCWVDLELPLQAVSAGWAAELERFAPFGQGNARPTVIIRGVAVEVQSARSARISDGSRSIDASGAFSTPLAGAPYDVIAAPMLAGGEVRLAIRGVRAAAAPSARGPIAGTRCTPSPA